MNKLVLAPVARAWRDVGNRRFVAGTAFGLIIMASTLASASGGGWLNGLLGGGADGGPPVDQSSVIAQSLNSEATDCANGAPGTIGEAIQTAVQVQTDLASATPNVETFFDVSSDCFSGLSQIFDLSFAIPSLASIISAAEDAVLKFAQKKVCSAVQKVSGVVTSPINQAIDQVNSLQGFTNINGMANSAMGGLMNKLDPQLGSQFKPQAAAPGAGFVANANPFGVSQTSFDPGSSGGSSAGGGGSAAGPGFGGSGGSGAQVAQALSAKAAQLNAGAGQVAAASARIASAQQALQEAQSAQAACAATGADCSAQSQAVQDAQQALADAQSALADARRQLASVRAARVQAPAAPLVLPGQSGGQSSQSQDSGSWWSTIAGIFK